MGRLGKVCRRFRGAGGSSDGGDEVVVGVVNNIVDVDGGCAAIDSGDVAALTDASRRVTGAVGAGSRSFSV
jgi:hypothetical protein